MLNVYLYILQGRPRLTKSCCANADDSILFIANTYDQFGNLQLFLVTKNILFAKYEA